MDNTVLKKRLSTFRTTKGSITRVTDDVLIDVLRAWESWTGTSKDFYREVGVSQTQMATIVGKAKKLKRDGHFAESEFKEIKLESSAGVSFAGGPCQGIELAWDGGKLIRFTEVSQLVDFLKKVA